MNGPFAIQSPSVRYRHMAQLVKWSGATTIIEIGSWLGASAIAWAKAMEDQGKSGLVWCVDPWKPYDAGKGGNVGEMVQALQDGDSIYETFRENVKAAGVERCIGTMREEFAIASEYLRWHLVDLIYLDGNHHHPAPFNDLAIIRDHQQEGLVICGDDLEAMIGVNVSLEQCLADKDYDCAGLPNGGWYHPGVTLAVYRLLANDVTVYDGFWIAGQCDMYGEGRDDKADTM